MTATADLLPNNAEALAHYRFMAMTDTGFVCRNLLGWNYDEGTDGSRINVGTGGVRADGQHGRMVRFIDDPIDHDKLILAPRGSYKSTISQGFVVRHILANSNVRILYGMKTDRKVQEKALAIRNCLEMQKIVRLFGTQKGPQWEIDRFTVAQRKQTNLQEATFNTFSLESLPVGGHYDIIIVDDLIDHENCKTPEAIENSKRVAALLSPLLVNGGYLVFIGTRYADEDMYHDLLNKRHVAKFVVGAGVRVIKEQGKGFDLEVDEGGITFPHLTLERLKLELQRMLRGASFYEFSCQYLNVVPTGLGSPFTRRMFKPDRWRADMRFFSGYLLTDTATSLQQQGCYSVVLYVLYDDSENLYLADCRVGHWRPMQFVDQVFDMLERWQGRANHMGELWEGTSLPVVFLDMLESDARRKRIKIRPIAVPRAGAADKYSRVEKLEQTMLQGRFAVLDSVPRTFVDLDGERLLYDPEGYRDTVNGAIYPSGELVDEFVRLRAHPKVDIADALAMAVETDKATGKRFCLYKAPTQKQLKAIEVADSVRTGLPVRKPAASITNDPDRPSWWDGAIKDHLHGP